MQHYGFHIPIKIPKFDKKLSLSTGQESNLQPTPHHELPEVVYFLFPY